MKKQELIKNITGYGANPILSRQWRKIIPVIEKFEARISGKRGAEDARDEFYTSLERLYVRQQQSFPAYSHLLPNARQKARFNAWKHSSALTLAEKAGLRTDEHGTWPRGDHLSVSCLDFVGHWESVVAPYCDMGGEGLGLVSVTRTRTYAKTSKWGPSRVTTTFLVGKNEAGTYFSHSVSSNCSTVIEALQWIWNGKAYDIIQRQGDVALIGGNHGPKMPSYLPPGHRVHGNIITHATHPDLPMPKNPGERIIIGRRAAERASEATRD